MTKEFEALKRLRQETIPATYNPDFDKEECLEVIEKALLELKAIKEAKPSDTLRFLEYLRESSRDVHADSWADTIKQALIQAEKELKALDVLVKYFNFTFYERIKQVCIQSKEDDGCYDTTAMADLEKHKAEFELLKEVLEG